MSHIGTATTCFWERRTTSEREGCMNEYSECEKPKKGTIRTVMSEEKNERNELSSSAWLGCPFCGNSPSVETLGTWIEVGCCVSMSRQKSDYLTIEERETWDAEEIIFSKSAEAKALNSVRDEWNTRQPNRENSHREPSETVD